MSSKQNDWISRQVAGLARYPAKRPAGLRVDDSGAFKLSALMSSWGLKQNLTKEAIVEALHKNRFHDGSSNLRFAMVEEPNADTIIRVHRRKEAVTEASLQKHEQQGHPGLAAWSKDAEKSEDEKTPPWTAWLLRKGSAHAPAAAAGTKPTQPKMLPPSVKAQGALKRKDPEDGKSERAPWGKPWDAREKWQGQSAWQRRGGGESWGAGDWKQGDDGWQGSGGSSRGEKVQRWLSYALKTGTPTLGIEVVDGWAVLDDLAEVLHKRRSDLGVADGQQLWELLRDTDEQGRFEVDARGRVRKVEREKRVASTNAKAKFASGGPATAGATAPENDAREVGDRPPSPPGQHWIKYIDDEVLWWFYDGPKGKWWQQQHDTEPQPWIEEDEED